MVPIHEDFWTRTDGLQVDREHLLMALADVDFILIRASDNDKEPRLANDFLSFQFIIVPSSIIRVLEYHQFRYQQ